MREHVSRFFYTFFAIGMIRRAPRLFRQFLRRCRVGLGRKELAAWDERNHSIQERLLAGAEIERGGRVG
jgi:hypothetical protein